MSTAVLTTLVPARAGSLPARRPSAASASARRADGSTLRVGVMARTAARRTAMRLPPRGAIVAPRAVPPRDDASAPTPDAPDALLFPPVSPRDDDASTAAPRIGTLALSAVALALACRADAALAAEFAPAAWIKSFGAGVVGFFSTPEAKELWMYTLKTVISWGVPAGVVGAAAFFAIASSRRGDADRPDRKKSSGGPFGFLGGGAGAGEPPSPFVIKRMNDRLDSYAYAFQSATVSKESVDAARKRKAFAEKYAATLGKLTVAEREAVTKATERWRREDAALRAKMAAVARSMRSAAVKKASKGGKKDSADADADADAYDFDFLEMNFDEIEDAEERAAAREAAAAAATATAEEETSEAPESESKFPFSLPGGGAEKKLAKLAAKRAEAEASYVQAVAAALPAHKRARLAKLLSDPRVAPGWEGDRDPLALPAERAASRDKPHVFVLQFFGDVRATQAAALREEVTAVLRSAKKSRGDEVVLVLNTGGGTVTGYGLAAAQLTRLRDAGVKLTVCVEQVAASGGYMMACTADRLVASPFAVLGSIGVISEVPNVYERLKKEGIQFETVTAGKFKRTLTPTKKIDPKDVEKSKADIEDVLTLFKAFVAQQRPSLNIDEVATGETWFGADALKRGLCDELKTTDDVLLGMLAEGAEIYSVKYQPRPSGAAALLAGGGDDASVGSAGGWNALRRVALGVAGFAAAAGGAERAVGGGGAAMAADAAAVADKVMARDGRYAGDRSDALAMYGGAFGADDDVDYL